MPRGRARQFNPKIPAHIDQAKLPAGIYYSDRGIGHWYVLEGTGKARRKRYVHTGAAKLSELHQIMEAPATATAGTLDALWSAFRESEQWVELAKSTRDGYTTSAKLVREYVLKDGRRVGDLSAQRDINRPMLQRMIDKLARKDGKPTPSRAVHAARLLAVLTNWGANRGMCASNLANKLDLPKERKNPRMPDEQAHEAVIEFARARGALKRAKGAAPPYLWAVAEIAYLCRLRRSEVCDLSESDADADGIHCDRRKGSDASFVTWSPRLRAAWLHLLAERDRTWARRKMPIPMRAEDRPLVVDLVGERLNPRAATQAWRKLQKLAIAEGVITAQQQHGLHGLKHRGITDTPGTRGQKRQASGHRNESQLARYDHEVPVVQPAGKNGGKIPEKT